ncbi:Quinol monooxygenase YgiN [Paenibacillus sp. UNC496MF]|nr:Quinol monooxygenase YgiN [Paenibacillus sp. UNC496MF]
METITIVALLKGREGYAAQLREVLLKLGASSRAEEGCLTYVLHESRAYPEQFVLYEAWKNEAALAEHLASSHYRAYRRAAKTFIDRRDVYRLNTLSN